MKQTLYFSHDTNARNDAKLINLRIKYGMKGIGIYWCIIEMLYEEKGYILTSEYERIAYELQTEIEIIKSVINDFNLFKKDKKEKMFFSQSVLDRLEKRKIKSDKARASANKRWELQKPQNKSERIAKAMRTHSKGNAIKEKEKEKEKNINNKEKESKEKGNSLSLLEIKKEKENPVVLSKFEYFWNLYDNKVTEKKKSLARFKKISPKEYEALEKHIKLYKQTTIKKGEPKHDGIWQQRRQFAVYLNAEDWKNPDSFGILQAAIKNQNRECTIKTDPIVNINNENDKYFEEVMNG